MKIVSNSTTLENDFSTFTDDDSDHDRFLCHAASILRDELSDLKSSDRYPAPNEIRAHSRFWGNYHQSLQK